MKWAIGTNKPAQQDKCSVCASVSNESQATVFKVIICYTEQQQGRLIDNKWATLSVAMATTQQTSRRSPGHFSRHIDTVANTTFCREHARPSAPAFALNTRYINALTRRQGLAWILRKAPANSRFFSAGEPRE
jgi:hypothetical protein